jgi:hypothetical protein
MSDRRNDFFHDPSKQLYQALAAQDGVENLWQPRPGGRAFRWNGLHARVVSSLSAHARLEVFLDLACDGRDRTLPGAWLERSSGLPGNLRFGLDLASPQVRLCAPLSDAPATQVAQMGRALASVAAGSCAPAEPVAADASTGRALEAHMADLGLDFTIESGKAVVRSPAPRSLGLPGLSLEVEPAGGSAYRLRVPDVFQTLLSSPGAEVRFPLEVYLLAMNLELASRICRREGVHALETWVLADIATDDPRKVLDEAIQGLGRDLEQIAPVVSLTDPPSLAWSWVRRALGSRLRADLQERVTAGPRP